MDSPHHVIQRGNGRRTVFFTDKDREVYLDLFFDYAARYGLTDLPRAHRRYFGANLLIVRWLQFVCGNGLLSTTYFSGR